MIMVEDSKTPTSIRVVKVIENTKPAVVTAAGTVGISLGSLTNWIPDDIGKIGALVGICLSMLLILVQIRRHKMDIEKHKLETELLRRQIENESKESGGDSCGD